ncbi:MAG: hypothetical protein Q8S17_00740 [Humidesulfovibrio sp.]|nr:hypothetical protein [Humidesulfovibrio sp.]
MSANLLAVPFLPAHAASLRLRPGAVSAMAGLPPLASLARVYAAAGPAWSVLDGATVIACGGVVRFWPGVGECWCWAGASVDVAPVAFARLARRVVDSLLREQGFHRLQLHTRLDDVRANRFASHLGFTLEGRCPCFGADRSTHNLYGRYRTWKQ